VKDKGVDIGGLAANGAAGIVAKKLRHRGPKAALPSRMA
jgi:hypothetical protein